MQFSGSVVDYILEECSYHQSQGEFGYETLVVPDSTIVQNNECIDAVDPGSDKEAINRGAPISESRGDWNAGVLPAQFNKVEIIHRKKLCC
jgi:hypothetical protein